MRHDPGDIIRFTYKHQAVDEHTGPPNKEVLVLHPNWHNKIHAIDLKRVSPAERKVLEYVLDPRNKGKPSRIPLINNIMKRMDPVEEIQNPQSFYLKFVKPFLNGKDAYRQYIPHLMSNVVRIRKQGQPVGQPERPLFPQAKSPFQKSKETEPQKPLTPVDVMQAADKQRRGQQAAAVKAARGLSPNAAANILKKFGL